MKEILHRLLNEWREAPNIELANRIVAVGALLKTSVTHKNWLEVAAARRPEDVSSLLSIAGIGKSAQLRERIEVLSQFPADPRIERFMTGRFEDREDVPLTAEMSAWLDELDHTVLAPRDARSLDELQAVFLSDPSNETSRAVLMDALLEVDDPRATLMVMQAEGADDIAKFVKANATSLLGELALIIKLPAEFHRGWLHSAELRQRVSRESTAGNPLWATVESLVGPGDELISVHPVMKSLRTLKRSALRVAELPAQLERLLEYRLDRADVLQLADPKLLPSLRELHVHAYSADVTLLLDRAVKLESFRADLILAMPRVAGHVIQQLLQLEGPHVVLGFLGWDGPLSITVEFQREGSVVAAHVSLSLEDTPTQFVRSTVDEAELLISQCREFGAVQVTIRFDDAVNEVDRVRLAALAD